MPKNNNNMKHIVLSLAFCSIFVFAKSQNTEKIIKAYFAGYEKKDWNLTASQFAEGFTFASPVDLTPISLADYQAKCFPTSKYVKKVEIAKFISDDKAAFAYYNIYTTDNKVIHNVEYYTFSKDKIKTIKCFFGDDLGYPGNTNTK